MAYLLPSPRSAWESQVLTLNNITYIFEYMWNSRENFWVLHINDTTGNPIVLGKRLIPSFFLYSMHNAFPGDIVLSNTTKRSALLATEPTLDNIGTDFAILYFTPDEIAQGVAIDV